MTATPPLFSDNSRIVCMIPFPNVFITRVDYDMCTRRTEKEVKEEKDGTER